MPTSAGKRQSLPPSLPIISTALLWRDFRRTAVYYPAIPVPQAKHRSMMNTPCLSNVRRKLPVVVLLLLVVASGCHAIDFHAPEMQTPVPPEFEPPRELSMVSLPTYRIEPPDVLRLQVIRLAPRQPYRIEPYDVLHVRALGTLRREPLNGYYLVESEGTVNLGPTYGVVRVVGLTIEGAVTQITRKLQEFLRNPQVSVQLARSTSAQHIAGTYMVNPDGAINLAHYGAVYVNGKTAAEAQEAVQRQLANYFDSPQVAVDVVMFNSKSYYVIVAGPQSDDNMRRLPISGNETVLDALAQVNGLSRVSSKIIWIARPRPGGIEEEQLLPVDYAAVVRGVTETNYQILPGDRIYIVDDSLVGLNSYVYRLTSPIERLLGVGNLSASVIRSSQVLGRDYNRQRLY